MKKPVVSNNSMFQIQPDNLIKMNSKQENPTSTLWFDVTYDSGFRNTTSSMVDTKASFLFLPRWQFRSRLSLVWSIPTQTGTSGRFGCQMQLVLSALILRALTAAAEQTASVSIWDGFKTRIIRCDGTR